MNSNLWIRKTVSFCLMMALLATYSMTALAHDGKVAGELVVSGNSINGSTASVLLNGEEVKTGRTVFSSSTINTPENTSAIVNLGKAGEIKIAPNSSLTLSFDANSANVDITAGAITVLRGDQGVNVTSAGTSQLVRSGESVGASATDPQTSGVKSPGRWWVWALIFGGAVVGIVVGASQGNNNIQLGGGSTVVSPRR